MIRGKIDGIAFALPTGLFSALGGLGIRKRPQPRREFSEPLAALAHNLNRN